MSEEDIIKEFICSDNFIIINDYITKPYEETIKEQDKEIERLNNIIDKLEIDIEIGTGNYTYDTDYNRGLKDAFIYMNDKLQELKGSDKE